MRAQQHLLKLKNGELNGKSIDRQCVYRHLITEYGNQCDICKLPGMWNNNPIRLWVDHINGNPTDNAWANFRLVCPNCDSQLDTCRNKNKGRGRKSMGLKW